MKMFRATWAVFAVVVLLASVSVALGRSKTPPAPPAQVYIIHDEESFLANTRAYHAIPFNDPDFEFEVRLPKDWTVDMLAKDREEKADQRLLSEVARFKSPRYGTVQAVLTIRFVKLEHDISPENWLKKYAASNGHIVQESSASPENRKASIGYLSTFDSVSNYTYTTAQINGNILMMASLDVPAKLQEAMAFAQKKIIDSFRMIIIEDRPVEEQKIFTLADALKFNYPASWNIYRSDFRDANALVVQLHNEPVAGKLNGIVRIVAIRRSPETSLKKEMDHLRDYLGEELKLSVGELVSSQEQPHISRRFLFSRREKYTVKTESESARAQELDLAVLGDRKWYVSAFLVSPLEADSLGVWAENSEAFSAIVRSMR